MCQWDTGDRIDFNFLEKCYYYDPGSNHLPHTYINKLLALSDRRIYLIRYLLDNDFETKPRMSEYFLSDDNWK